MNKKTAIYIAALLMTFGVSAQTLAMPDVDAEVTEDASVQVPAAPESPKAEHNTPSQSYKAERNAIRSGNDFFKKEKYHEALEQYEKALGVNSGSIRGKFNKAVTLLELQSEDNKGTENDPRVQAERLFAEIIPDAKNYDIGIAEKAFYNLGNIAFNDQQYDRSIEMYKSALRINPDNMLTRENLRLAQLKKEEQEQNQDQQNQDQQDQQNQEQQDQQDQNQDQEQQQQQQPQPQQMTQSAQQILQSMQNKENQTRKKVKEQEAPATGRPNTDKPW